MKTIELDQVTALEPFVREGNGEPLILMENGRAVAAVVLTSEDEVEDLLLSINPQFQAILERSRQRLTEEGGLTTEQVRGKLGMPTAGSSEVVE